MNFYKPDMLRPDPIIAIDGFSSCGKSTLAKAVAKKLNLLYVDSGAMYRAVTLYFIKNKIKIPDSVNYDEGSISAILDKINISFKKNETTKLFDTYLNGENVETQIREMIVSDEVSRISSIKEVRTRMVEMQRNLGRNGGIVMDGRDIGTAVFPDADLKIFMTADPLVRTKRRYDELTASGIKVAIDEVQKNLEYRDKIDTTRKINPLRKAEDAIILDNSYLNKQEQLDFVIDQIEKLKTVSK